MVMTLMIMMNISVHLMMQITVMTVHPVAIIHLKMVQTMKVMASVMMAI